MCLPESQSPRGPAPACVQGCAPTLCCLVRNAPSCSPSTAELSVQRVEFSAQAKVCAVTSTCTPSESFSPHLACPSVRSSLLFLYSPWPRPGGGWALCLGQEQVCASSHREPSPSLRPWTCREKLLVASIRKRAGYFHSTREEGKHRAGLAHLCQHGGFWPGLKLAVPAEHGGGGGRSSAGWEALVSWGWEEGGSGAD